MELLFLRAGETDASLRQRIALARLLGHREVILLSSFDGRREGRRPESEGSGGAASRLQSPDVALRHGLLVATQQEAAAAARRGGLVFAPATREMAESRHVTHLLEPETGSRSDFLHHRNSGLHPVVLALCAGTPKRPAKTVVTTTRLLAKRAETILGRMAQNARWCAKLDVPYVVTSGASSSWEQRDAACLAALLRELRKN